MLIKILKTAILIEFIILMSCLMEDIKDLKIILKYQDWIKIIIGLMLNIIQGHISNKSAMGRTKKKKMQFFFVFLAKHFIRMLNGLSNDFF